MLLLIFLVVLVLVQCSSAAAVDDWRSRSIYQVFTDRFARSDGSTTAACNTSLAVYCGGSFQGIIQKLDYIQNMGFTAVRIPKSLFTQHQANEKSEIQRSGYLLSRLSYNKTPWEAAKPIMGTGNRICMR